MLTVNIEINGCNIARYTAVRVEGGTDPDDMNTYKMDTGDMIEHRYGDGAEALAEKMMVIAKELKRWNRKGNIDGGVKFLPKKTLEEINDQQIDT